MISEEQLQRALDAVDKFKILYDECGQSEFVHNVCKTLQNSMPYAGPIAIYRRHYTDTNALFGVLVSQNTIAYRDNDKVAYERYVYEVAISEYFTVERIEEAYDNYIKQKEQDEYESTTEYKMTIKEYKALTGQLQRIEELCKRNAR